MESSRSELGAGSFRVTHDIVGSLPPELLLLIVEKLDPADIVRSQRVRIAHFPVFNGQTTVVYVDWSCVRSQSDGSPYSRPMQSPCSLCAKRWRFWT